jgi:hypothetical protein
MSWTDAVGALAGSVEGKRGDRRGGTRTALSQKPGLFGARRLFASILGPLGSNGLSTQTGDCRS